MFEYVDFLHFDFRVNLSNSRHLQCNNDSCLSLFLTAHLIKQTSLKEPSWMSHYKGLLAYLVYLHLESLGI